MQEIAPKRLLTFKQAAELYPAFTESAFRWMRFNGDSNGFNACVRKVGRRVLLDADSFERWLDEQQEQLVKEPRSPEPSHPDFESLADDHAS